MSHAPHWRDVPDWRGKIQRWGTRSVEEDAAAISEGFCPVDPSRRLDPDGWCVTCQIYYGAMQTASGHPLVTRSNSRDYIDSFNKDVL